MRFSRTVVVLVVLAGVILATGLPPTPTLAANVTVTDCTQAGLAQAIDQADTADPNNPGLVTFRCPNPTITFSSIIHIPGNLQTAAVVIDGSNHGTPIILDGNNTTSFFRVDTGSHLTIQHMTLQNGNQTDGTEGGAIDADGTAAVTVIDTDFIGNQVDGFGGAISIDNGPLTIIQSTFNSNSAYIGGAITTAVGTVGSSRTTISQSSFTANSAEIDGGAIENYGELIVQRSTFINNHSGNIGGAIDARQGSVTIIASTLSGNTADGSLEGASGSAIFVSNLVEQVLIVASTIVQSEDATPALYISQSDALTLEGVILGGSGQHCQFDEGSLTDVFTYANDDSCELSAATSRENIPDLLLGPLATITINGVDQSYHPLIDGSPAIDAGPAVCDSDAVDGIEPDQLGNSRPVGPRCDIGAVEGKIIYPASLCSNRWNGALRMSDRCNRAELQISLTQFVPLTVCVNNWNSSTRLSQTCSRTEHAITIFGDRTIPVCINRYNTTLRVTPHRNPRPPLILALIHPPDS